MFSATVMAQQHAADAMHWLHRIQQAAQRLNYSGTFVYMRQGGLPQTSRVTHILEGVNERESLEILDGAPLVIIRYNDELKHYSPDARTLLVEKRVNKSSFPAMLVDQIAGIAEQYDARKVEVQRVAGLDCQVVTLEPKDRMRYSHKLWADLNTGLLLKAQTVNEKGEVVEQIGFSQVDIGGPAERYQQRLVKRMPGRDWRVSTPNVSPVRFADTGWKIDNAMPGFRKVLELKRGIGDIEVGQVVFSDGLASVSVFVEPLREGMKTAEGSSSQGPVNVFRRRIGEHLVTVLGEAPPACVARFAQSIEYRPVAKP
jgi:sigma-E factor negative regulatory protein RseB